MIVKRVAEALRRQDWAAVAIEFLLILMGILLAFQINEWASEREARAQRAAATERLLGEAEETVAYFRAGVRSQGALIGDLDYALGNIQRGTWRDADQARMTRGLATLAERGRTSSAIERLRRPCRLRHVWQDRRCTASHRQSPNIGRPWHSMDGTSIIFGNACRCSVNPTPFIMCSSRARGGEPGWLSTLRNWPLIPTSRNWSRWSPTVSCSCCKSGRGRCETPRRCALRSGRVVGRPCNLNRPAATFD